MLSLNDIQGHVDLEDLSRRVPHAIVNRNFRSLDIECGVIRNQNWWKKNKEWQHCGEAEQDVRG